MPSNVRFSVPDLSQSRSWFIGIPAFVGLIFCVLALIFPWFVVSIHFYDNDHDTNEVNCMSALFFSWFQTQCISSGVCATNVCGRLNPSHHWFNKNDSGLFIQTLSLVLVFLAGLALFLICLTSVRSCAYQRQILRRDPLSILCSFLAFLSLFICIVVYPFQLPAALRDATTSSGSFWCKEGPCNSFFGTKHLDIDVFGTQSTIQWSPLGWSFAVVGCFSAFCLVLVEITRVGIRKQRPFYSELSTDKDSLSSQIFD